MGMYNLVFGANPAGPTILAMLGFKSVGEVGRYRDCFISEGKIAIYTRNGGRNREHWDDNRPAGEECTCPGCTIEYRLPKHPNYLYDRDDEFDYTYATVYFSFPAEWKELLEKMDSGEKWDPDARWLTAIEQLRAGLDTQAVHHHVCRVYLYLLRHQCYLTDG